MLGSKSAENLESILECRLKNEKRKSEEITETGTHVKHRIRHAGKTIDEVETEQEMQRIFALISESLIECSVKIINLKFKEREPFEHAKTASNEIVKRLSTSYRKKYFLFITLNLKTSLF